MSTWRRSTANRDIKCRSSGQQRRPPILFVPEPLFWLLSIGIEEAADFTFGLFTVLAIPLLNQSGQPVRVTFGLGEVIIRQLAPHGLGFSDQLFPLACSDVVVHKTSC
ncbi:protein of unknown function [Burkholderia multivorans]